MINDVIPVEPVCCVNGTKGNILITLNDFDLLAQPHNCMT